MPNTFTIYVILQKNQESIIKKKAFMSKKYNKRATNDPISQSAIV